MVSDTHSQESYNRGGMITFILSMIVSIGFFLVILIFHKGVDLKEVSEPAAAVAAPGTAAPVAGSAASGATETAPAPPAEQK